MNILAFGSKLSDCLLNFHPQMQLKRHVKS
jgi:hypothetical protein